MSTDMHMKRHVTAAVLAVTFLQAVVALQLVLAPGQARAQPRDAPRPSTWLALPGQDSLSTQMEVPSMGVTSTGVPSIRAVQAGSLGLPPGPAARQGQFCPARTVPPSALTRRLVPSPGPALSSAPRGPLGSPEPALGDGRPDAHRVFRVEPTPSPSDLESPNNLEQAWARSNRSVPTAPRSAPTPPAPRP